MSTSATGSPSKTPSALPSPLPSETRVPSQAPQNEDISTTTIHQTSTTEADKDGRVDDNQDEDEDEDEHDDDNAVNTTGTLSMFDDWMYAVIASIVLCCICTLIVVAVCYKKRKRAIDKQPASIIVSTSTCTSNKNTNSTHHGDQVLSGTVWTDSRNDFSLHSPKSTDLITTNYMHGNVNTQHHDQQFAPNDYFGFMTNGTLTPYGVESNAYGTKHGSRAVGEREMDNAQDGKQWARPPAPPPRLQVARNHEIELGQMMHYNHQNDYDYEDGAGAGEYDENVYQTQGYHEEYNANMADDEFVIHGEEDDGYEYEYYYADETAGRTTGS